MEIALLSQQIYILLHFLSHPPPPRYTTHTLNLHRGHTLHFVNWLYCIWQVIRLLLQDANLSPAFLAL